MIAESPALLCPIPASSRLHVVTITPFFPALGDEASGCFVAEPLPYLSQLGVTSTPIAVEPFYRRKQFPSLQIPSQRIHYPCIPGNWGLATAGALLAPRLLDRLSALHRRRRIDLIHAHSALPCGQAARLIGCALKIPYVVTVHGLDAFSTSQVHGVFGHWCKRTIGRIYREARGVFCVSQEVLECVKAGCPDARATVIHNGVDPQLFHPVSKTSASETILCVGNLIPSKGQDVLLRAFAEVRNRAPQSALQFVGEGPEELRLRRLAEQLDVADAVTFRGRQSREAVARAMRECSIFALPSSYEGLGCVYLEAMACSKPVIGCRGQGIEDIVEDGKNGYLVVPGDHRSLSQTIFQLIQNQELRESIGRRARRTILDRCTFEHQAAAMVEAYSEACR